MTNAVGAAGYRRAIVAALGVSLAAHLGLGVALSMEQFGRLFRPKAVAMPPRPTPQKVRLQLVNTPDSAETAAPPRDSPFISDRNTRAQDQTPPAPVPAKDQPHIEDKGESTDLRQVAMARRAGTPQAAAAVAPTAPPPPQPVAPPRPVPTKPATVPLLDPLLPEPVTAPAAPAQPTPEVRQLPPKDVTATRRQVAKLERELAALREAADERAGRATLSAVQAEELANAQVEGEFSYGASQHFFGEYLLQMKDEVERHWISRLLTEYSGILHSRVTIDFKIYGNGHVGALQVVDARGDEYFPILCLHAIKDASPFLPVPYTEVEGVPRDLYDKPLNIRFTFQYN